MLIYDVLHKETIYHSIVNDLRSFGVKYRFKKNTFKTERTEGVKNISKKVFKTPLLYQPLDIVNLSSGGIVHVPVFVSQASTFLEKFINQEGLFRKAGSQLRQKELMARLDNGGTLGDKHHAIDVANCLKTFFRELPEPLIPYTYHDLFVHCVMLKSYQVQAILLACILLPPHHLNTLAFFMEFLKKVSLYEKLNKMSIDNLAKVVTPNIMPLQETTMSAMQMRLELHLAIVKILIENAENIGILPDHITQAISMETIGSTDNELDVSESQSRLKPRKKKHRSGSLTRKPHLTASNLNLRMFNGLKKIVGKGSLPDDNNVNDNQQLSVNHEPLQVSNIKSTKKRKVIERLEPPRTKKKRGTDKSEKLKKMRLSLDRFVPKGKPKIADGDLESYINTFDSYTERRWSSVSNSYDSERKCRTYSDGSPQLQLILKDNEASNAELQREYNNVFIDANVNLSDDSDEQVLLTKDDHTDNGKCHVKLSSNLEEVRCTNNFDGVSFYTPKKRLSINNVETYSHINVTSLDNHSEEYVTIPKSEYEDIKNRVSAIESRLSQEFGCENSEESCSLVAHSVKKVQTAYEKTLEETRVESTTTADYLARKLGKELKIRRSGEHKIIRSPSARKIGSLRRRSQERIMSKRVKRSASWHISHELNNHGIVQSQSQCNEENANNAFTINEQTILSSNYIKETAYRQPKSISHWEENKNNSKINNICTELNRRKIHGAKRFNTNRDLDSTQIEPVQSLTKQSHMSVRRVSSFHGNEFANTATYIDEKVEKLKKTNSQQNIILNNICPVKSNITPDSRKKTNVSWKDADRYFKSSNSGSTPLTQTGRASIAKLRTQNAGMVLAKAKLFDEGTTKMSTQAILNKKQEWSSTNNERFVNALKHKEADKQNSELLDHSRKRNESSSRKIAKSVKNKNAKPSSSALSSFHHESETANTSLEMNQQQAKWNVKDSKPYKISVDETVDVSSDLVLHQKENVIAKTPVLMKKVPINTMSQELRLSTYKPDANNLCKTPHIKKPLTVKTPKSTKVLVRKSINDSRRTPLKAVSQLGTPKYHSPKSILKTRNFTKHA